MLKKLRFWLANVIGIVPCLLIAWPVHVISTLLTLSGWYNITGWLMGDTRRVSMLWTTQMGPTYVSSRFPVWAMIALGAAGTGAGLGLKLSWLWMFSGLSVLLGVIARVVSGGPSHWTYGGLEPESRRDKNRKILGSASLGYLEIDPTWAPFQNAPIAENMRGDETLMTTTRTKVIRKR